MEEFKMSDYIAHHGIIGQKWGVRRFQNPDGTLTEAGRKHYGYESKRTNSKVSELTDTGRGERNKVLKDTNNSARDAIQGTIKTAKSANRIANKAEEIKYTKKACLLSML